jgi:hypothetical protein
MISSFKVGKLPHPRNFNIKKSYLSRGTPCNCFLIADIHFPPIQPFQGNNVVVTHREEIFPFLSLLILAECFCFVHQLLLSFFANWLYAWVQIIPLLIFLHSKYLSNKELFIYSVSLFTFSILCSILFSLFLS